MGFLAMKNSREDYLPRGNPSRTRANELTAPTGLALVVCGGTLRDCFNDLTMAVCAFGGIAVTELADDLRVLSEECSRLRPSAKESAKNWPTSSLSRRRMGAVTS